MLRPLNRVTGTDPVVIAPDVLQAIIDELVRLGKFKVIPPLMMVDNQAGRVLSVRAGGNQELFPVRIEKSAGVQGSNSTAATWRYTVRPLSFVEEPASGDDDPILEEFAEVGPPRPLGRMLYQEGKFGIGIAYYENDGTLVLHSAGETLDTEYCSQLQSGS